MEQRSLFRSVLLLLIYHAIVLMHCFNGSYSMPADHLNSAYCPDGNWTEWFDLNTPGISETDGDFELLSDLLLIYDVCETPFLVQCKEVGSDSLYDDILGQINVTCEPDLGLICLNKDQVFKCADYEVRFFCHCSTTSEPMTSEKSDDDESMTTAISFSRDYTTPSGTGDAESAEIFTIVVTTDYDNIDKGVINNCTGGVYRNRVWAMNGESYAIQYNPFQNDLLEFTVCFWMRTSDTDNFGTPFHYATWNTDTEDEISLYDYNDFTLFIRGQMLSYTKVSVVDDQWHHICVTWQSHGGNYQLYKDGVVESYGGGVATNLTIRAGGVLAVGQEQGEPGGGFSKSRSFMGMLAYFNMWSRVLNETEIVSLYSDCADNGCGDIVSWSSFEDTHVNDITIIDGVDICKTLHPCLFPYFPDKSWGFYENDSHVTLAITVDELSESSVAFWFRCEDIDRLGTVLHYSTNRRDDELIIYLGTLQTGIGAGLALKIADQDFNIPLAGLGESQWHHVCIEWKTVDMDTLLVIYFDTAVVFYRTSPTRRVVHGTGVITVGQRDLGNRNFDSTRRFVGRIAGLNMWSQMLNGTEIERLGSVCKNVGCGDLITWAKFTISDLNNVSVHDVFDLCDDIFITANPTTLHRITSPQVGISTTATDTETSRLYTGEVYNKSSATQSILQQSSSDSNPQTSDASTTAISQTTISSTSISLSRQTVSELKISSSNTQTVGTASSSQGRQTFSAEKISSTKPHTSKPWASTWNDENKETPSQTKYGGNTKGSDLDKYKSTPSVQKNQDPNYYTPQNVQQFDNSPRALIILIFIVVVLFIAAVIISCFVYRKCRRHKGHYSPNHHDATEMNTYSNTGYVT